MTGYENNTVTEMEREAYATGNKLALELIERLNEDSFITVADSEAKTRSEALSGPVGRFGRALL